ncbi:MAG: DUF4974 domain-containing protein [Odoribacteraceae bacterium]|jgi:ferric-dicitrate binding protein FerR (iron transport regulator)|nr:DUF4974 domain-containing protein [Odoribacteraceae bacterium]
MEKWIEWVIPYCKSELSAEAREEREAWMAESAENRRLFEEAARAYRKARRVAAWDRAKEEEAWEQVVRAIGRRRRRRLSLRRFGLTACVATLLVGAAYLLARRDGGAEEVSWPLVRPGEGKAVLRLADGREVALGAGTVVADTALGFRVLADTVGVSYRSVAAVGEGGTTFHTLLVPRGGEYFLVLSDGSRVWLNADSELRYPAVFGDRREVYLSGEAYFQVSGEDRPFSVTSGETRAEVLGTRFNVSAYADESRVVTTLEAGRLRVWRGAESRELLPGSRVVSTPAGLEVSVANAEMDLGWVHRAFDFAEKPLGEITRQLQRWYDVKFAYRDAGLEEIPFTGTVSRDLPLQDVLRVIEQLADIRFTPRGAEIEVTRNKEVRRPHGFTN